jgi:8-oxo-dGTP pyrophosphatase MutT (NUDIX family)
VTAPGLDADWHARLQAAAQCPPLRARQPLWWRSRCIGSVEPDLFARAGLAGEGCVAACSEQGQPGWRVEGELSVSLVRVAEGLHRAGLAHVWRNELLAVRDDSGSVVGAVERAAVRPLGIATHAVHLAGFDAQGRLWVQQRAFDKPSDPGRWDTLVGGMVPAGEGRDEALARETWEEAGLRPGQLHGLRHGGRIVNRRPLPEVPHGYVVESIDWFTCVLPAGVQPVNQDGEVACFALMERGEAIERLRRDAFTLDAALVLARALAANQAE